MNSEQADILDLLSGHTDDTTIERLAFECLLTNMTDDRVVSLMNILGWQGDFNCFAIGGVPSASLASTSLAIRKAVLTRYGIGSLAELPKCEYTVAMSQIQMWNEMLRVRDCVREARKADAGETKA